MAVPEVKGRAENSECSALTRTAILVIRTGFEPRRPTNPDSQW